MVIKDRLSGTHIAEHCLVSIAGSLYRCIRREERRIHPHIPVKHFSCIQLITIGIAFLVVGERTILIITDIAAYIIRLSAHSDVFELRRQYFMIVTSRTFLIIITDEVHFMCTAVSGTAMPV